MALADWLAACGVETVAMESTGVYWIPLFEVLEARGFEVMLVDARQLKSVPGARATCSTASGCSSCIRFGLLRGAFRPPETDRACCGAYLRQRAMLIAYAGQHVQHMQKALDQMNLQLDRCCRDITGVTGLTIIRAILDGERDPRRLAALRDGRCKHSEETIAQALQGNWREEHLFALGQARRAVPTPTRQIADCDERIELTWRR